MQACSGIYTHSYSVAPLSRRISVTSMSQSDSNRTPGAFLNAFPSAKLETTKVTVDYTQVSTLLPFICCY